LISAQQNNLKTSKKINLKQRKKLKKLIFFKNPFKTQKQIGPKQQFIFHLELYLGVF
jgi:hypothetical protein